MSKQDNINKIISYLQKHHINGIRFDSGNGIDYFHCHHADVIRGNIIGCDCVNNKIRFFVDMIEYRYDGQCKPDKKVNVGIVGVSASKVSKDEVIEVCKLLKLI